MEKGFSKKEGPFVKALDDALQSVGVHRQQYFGGARFRGCNYFCCLKTIKQKKFVYTQTRFCNYLFEYSQKIMNLKFNSISKWILGNFLVRYQGQKLQNETNANPMSFDFWI